jgi:hypothetical protein
MSARPNAELAYRVLDHIDANPEQWRQKEWISRLDGADCGTAGCFAGWASLLSGDEPGWAFSDDDTTDIVVLDDESTPWVGDRAAELLGITTEQQDELFDGWNTREDLGRLVAEIFGPRPGGAQ